MRGYQRDDEHLVDYQLASVPGLEAWGAAFRGPVPCGAPTVVCLGAAQTFGRLCKEPYPALVGQTLGRRVLNLGMGGAGPALFLRPEFLAVINRAPVVVLQVMSARSQSTRAFRTDGNMQGVRTSDGKSMVAEEFFEDLVRTAGTDQLAATVREFQDAYTADMKRLIKLINGSVIVLWFSVRSPDWTPSLDTAHGLLGAFPQLVTREMVDDIASAADLYVECVTSEGLPRQIMDRDGLRSSFVLDYRLADPRKYVVTTDNYYPTPEMHRSVAKQVAPACVTALTAR